MYTYDYFILGGVPWGILKVSGVSLRRLLRGETILLMKGGDTMSSDIGRAVRSGNLGTGVGNTMSEPKTKNSQIPTALDELNRGIEKLENMIFLLNDKLVNILRSTSPVGQVENSAKEFQDTVPLAAAIFNSAKRVYASSDSIDDLIGRLEL